MPLDGGGVGTLGAGRLGTSSAVWTTTAAAGVFRSLDGGLTWNRSRTAPSLRGSLAGVDPRDGDRAFVMFLPVEGGTGALGLFFTTDGGESWTRSTGLGRATFVYQVAFHPRDPDVLYAAVSNGAYRSEDGGRSWTRIAVFPNEYVFAIAVVPDAPRILLVSTLDRVYRSTDAGATFTEVFGSSMYIFAFDPRDSSRVYGTGGPLFRSTDRGLTWEQIGLPEGGFDALTVADDGTVYAGSRLGVFRSRDGGTTFTPRIASETARRPDDAITSLLALPGRDVLASGVRGVWRLDAGENGWKASSRGIRTLNVAGLTVTAAGRVLASVPLNAVFWSNDGESFRATARGLRTRFDVPGLDLISSPSNPEIVYGSTNYQFFRSEDGGVTWRELQVPNPAPLVRILAVHPTDPDVIYAAGQEQHPREDYGKCHVLRSHDGGTTWDCLEGTDIYAVDFLVIDPEQPRRLFANDGGGLQISNDEGETWRRAGQGLPTSEGLSTGLARDTRGRLYMATWEGIIFRSVDGGESFSRIGRILPQANGVRSLISDPRRPDTLYATVERNGIFRSQDGGRRWERLGTGLPGLQFNGVVALDAERGKLFAGTYGRGLYVIDVP